MTRRRPQSGLAEATVWDVVRAQARRTPSAVAVRTTRVITYRELLGHVDQAAADLSAAVPPGGLVALEATGHAVAIVAILAAAQAGCAILPLSAVDPPRRRASVLADAAPAAIARESADGGLVVSPAGAAARNLGHAAYVMYTSGSTGQPKGVVVSHNALLKRLRGLAAVPGLRAGESMAALSALSFDIVMAEMLLPLTVGGVVEVSPAQAHVDPMIFDAFIAERVPDVIQATPSFWRLALAWGWPGLRSARLWCGGEALTAALADRLLASGAQLWNMYGPTEATIWASAARVRSPDLISLGDPLPGSGLFLDGGTGSGAVAGPGSDGEIILYGDGLADGYLGAPGATAERFVNLATPDGPRACYRTGDRARRRGDGALEFLGRDDGQVKFRGHRVELTGIEAALEEHPQITEAAALVRNGEIPERAAIAAYVATRNSQVTPHELRAWLAERLPPAARPGSITIMDSLPRTGAGKVDRSRLSRTTRSPGTEPQATADG